MVQLTKNKKGTTLVEMVVVVALFAVTMLSATGIFQMVINGQRNAIATQNVEEGMRYAFEVMAKEMRMAQKDDRYCDGVGVPDVPDEYVYETGAGDTELYFKNIHDECVTYSLENDLNGVSRLKIARGAVSGYITPNDIEVSNLEFDVVHLDLAGGNQQQARVTIKMDIEAQGGKQMHKTKMKVQTTISSRYYE